MKTIEPIKHISSHTQGPWTAEAPPSSMLTCRWIKGPGAEIVALVGHEDFTSDSQEMDLANARLIAAAPELLEALQYYASESAKAQGYDNGAFARAVLDKHKLQNL